MKRITASLILAAALALSACSGGSDQKETGAGKAEGEILPGSISDAQLPLDTVKSQSPLAPKVEGDGKPKAKASEAAGEAAPEEAAAADAPAAEEKPAGQ